MNRFHAHQFFLGQLDRPRKVTETEFFARIKNMPKGKSYSFLR